MGSATIKAECTSEIGRPPLSAGTKLAKQHSLAFRPDIEGLRGIAILIVVGFHMGIPGFSGGFVGVDVFFVLSGYLITGLLLSEIEKTSRLSLLQFYARRVRRLLPACTLTAAVTLMIGAVTLAPNELAFAGRAARATALYMSNIFFSLNAAYYFAPSVKSNALLHTWSLGVEEQFYLFWPLLIFVGLVWWRSKAALASMVLVITIISLGASIWLARYSGTFAFYELPTRAWEFGIGGLAAFVPRGILKIPVACGLALGWLGLSAILISGYLISGNSNFPGYIALLPVMGTATALVTGAEVPVRGIGVVLGYGPLQRLGALSYSWYLWHWPFLFFSGALLPKISVAGKAAVAVGSLGVAAITHGAVENPIRFHPYLVQRPSLTLYLAGAMTACSLSVATLSMGFANHLMNEPEMKLIKATIGDMGRLPIQRCASPLESAEVKSCVFGNSASQVNLVLFGDSHAMQWFNPLQDLAESHGWKLTTIVKPGCPATDVNPPGDRDRVKENCARWRARVIREIVALRPSIVFLGNAAVYLGRKDKLPSQFDISLTEWRDGTRRTLAALTAGGTPVVQMRDMPLPFFDVPTCLARSIRHSWYQSTSCNMDKSVALNPSIFDEEKAAAYGLTNVHFLDLTDELCQGNVCLAVKNGMITYWDDNHLTGRFAESLTPVLEAGLLPILKPHS